MNILVKETIRHIFSQGVAGRHATPVLQAMMSDRGKNIPYKGTDCVHFNRITPQPSKDKQRVAHQNVRQSNLLSSMIVPVHVWFGSQDLN